MQEVDHKGLTNSEVEASRLQHGSNRIEARKKNRFWEVVREIVSEPLFLILVSTSLIYFVVGSIDEGIIMVVALLLVAGISLFQENRSRSAMDKLRLESGPHAKVIRNGQSTHIPTEEIVIGDLLVLEDGTIIPADALVLELHDFSVSESILTGESLPVLKSTAEDNNQLFQGTMVLSGSCTGRVVAIGAETALGKIGTSLETIESVKTPLQIQIRSFIRSMVGFGIIAFLVVWGLHYFIYGNLLQGLLQGLTLAMSILPEEIPVAFSTFMALGAYHLYKKKIIARTPHTVETLGAATVICVDKTGTLTANHMTIASIFSLQEDKLIDYLENPGDFNEVLEYAMWSSEMVPFDNMEKAIHDSYGATAPEDKRPAYKMVHEYPLGGIPPIMTHVFQNNKNHRIIACKGSLEGVLKQCALSPEKLWHITELSNQLTAKGYRVLGVAQADAFSGSLPATQDELAMELLGLIAFADPPKKNIQEVIKGFYDAGIQVKMITGDHAQTAKAIADQVELRPGKSMLTGKEVMDMSEASLTEKVRGSNIFARMFPEAKLKVIRALQANGEVVAMTGDGVNDGPALKAAHIGIAMGKRGSEIARNASSLILMDDNLAHMVEAVALGRRIYENLKKAIRYIISIHIPIILIVLLPLIFFWEFTDIFSPIHVIFLELIMGPTCSIVFENEPIEAGSMQRKPRKMTSSFFAWSELNTSIIQGLAITAACLGLGYYFIQTGAGDKTVRTIIYATLIFSNLFLTLVNRSFVHSVLTTLRYKNNLMPIILLASLVILMLSIYFDPVQSIFQLAPLSLSELALSLCTAFIGVIWIEVWKMVRRKKEESAIR
ncbi:MAG: cation-translocating P-type ATPase [Saprospiraceae bacterium]|nr:cation-translocating P-type ATPase [Saprospiraceae bacterium]